MNAKQKRDQVLEDFGRYWERLVDRGDMYAFDRLEWKVMEIYTDWLVRTGRLQAQPANKEGGT